jgi:bifunctional DNase/RNase
MAEVTVYGLKGSLGSRHWAVILKDVNGDRYLPIRISPFQANAIAVQLAGVNVRRPLTHDLLINDLGDNVFYAKIIMALAGRHIEIDSRPSDAIALAVRMKVPIFVDEAAMRRVSVAPQPGVKKTSRKEKEKLAVFRDFIDSLDLDDS